MKMDWKSTSPIPWREHRWGGAFRNMKGLEELEIELETSEDKVEELEAIVHHAKGWKFPMVEYVGLSADSLGPRKSGWRSSDCYWADSCLYCAERSELTKQGSGPMCTVMSLRYDTGWRKYE